jgi:hypothetical protein
MDEDRARTIQTRCQVVGTVVTVLGVVGILLQVHAYIETRANENRKKEEELISRLYTTDIDVNKMLFEHPLLQRALYDDENGETFGALSREERGRAYAISHMFGDMLEFWVLLERDVLKDEDGEQMAACWNSYIDYFWKHSLAFRKYMTMTQDTWTPRLKARFNFPPALRADVERLP